MSIYTRNGDRGNSKTIASKKDLRKSEPVFEVLGEFDELNASLGFLNLSCLDEIKKVGYELQKDLFRLSSFIAGKPMLTEHISFWAKRVEEIEQAIDYFNKFNDPLENFIFSGGSPESIYLHNSRVCARKLERTVVLYCKRNREYEFMISYLNRISDLLFVLSRYSNKKLGYKDVIWKGV